MKFAFLQRSAGLALACALSLQAAWAHPKAFSDLTFAAAKARAKAENKLLLVDFTASWCGPCHKMDEETWTSQPVEKWLKENTIAIQVDVDRDRPTATALKIAAMPTVVLFNAGQENEFDRETGFKQPPELLRWLDGVKRGKTSAAQLSEQAASVVGKGGEAEVEARYRLANKFLLGGKSPEATEQYIWLWKNIPKEYPPMIGVRASFMASDMAKLAKKYAPARTQFQNLREAAAKSSDRSDWIVLNQILGEEGETLKWFDQVKKIPAKKAEIEKVGYMLQDLLINSDRLPDVALLYGDPIQHLKDTYKIAEETKQLSRNYDPFPQEAAILYTCYLAAHQDDKADKIAREIMRLENTPAMRNRLVMTAFQADQFRPSQLKWLDDLKPDRDPSFYLERGIIFAQVDQNERALKDFEKAIASGQKSSNIYCARGNAHMKLNHNDLALADFNLAASLDPRNSWSWISKSALFYRQKKYEDAYAAGSKAIELDPKQFGGYCNRGKAALKLGKYEDAVSDLSKSTESNSKQYKGESYYYRSLAYDKLGKSQLAKKDMATAASLKFKAPPHEA
ncbi:MAG: thioredoxin family protein [Cyanobacteria bacterium SZAS TMP-1]|nr:thioredoxin family protein [Cyanobacteria bacterium SZAS TMP-1]